ncbi:MG2 domain-containing protein [Siccirubricoccus sp. KC 17139]|uniref:MG2 domain-containing protein n=1 Tax=Siccirubricoccus soli TaxID=2899147 RepID=A0ABT1D893_9PROT|nr:MG2 domain-containing protein [Siccirubricoccus soli]MCO6418126.1 MG2 domain-containing protein [Siccirubricoccus soli]MCP2684261.1 MG2 domain-containing protein [Siccirubricoccus soli]
MPRLLILLLGLLLAAPGLHAQGFDLPGLANDAAGYERELGRRFPAGATAAQKAAAEQRAAAAERQNNWPAAAQAWEDRIAGGDARAEHWLALARAQLRRTPPEANRALQAAWQNFQAVPAGAPELPSLLLMAEALRLLDRPAQRIQALEAVLERAPDNPAYRQQLADARREAGLLVARINTEAESEPARACLSFTVPPARRTDWQPQDWVRAEPPIPGMAVLREGDQICIAGLPNGQTTRLVLRAGLPGEDGLRLNRDMPVRVAMPNRRAQIIFDATTFLLPRGQAPRVGLATVNISALNLRVVRVTERTLIPFSRGNWTVGEQIESWTAQDLPESWGRVVWEGRVDLPRFEANRLQRHALPLPEGLRAAGPGLYALVVQPADGTRGRAAALPVIVTDLGLTAWRSSAGLAVQARGLQAGRPLPGAKLRLMATNNDILAEAETGPEGLVRFAAPLLRGQGPMAPKAVQAFLGDDFVQLDLEAASFDLSDRGATGVEHPGPMEAFLWLDRGIYRPGETVQAAALLRDAGGAPLDIPARLRLRRPNGSVYAEAVPAREKGAAILWPVQIGPGAPSGVWTLEVLADPNDPPIGKTEFRIDAFVPERLEVRAGPAPGPLVPGQALAIPLSARFLYGAPAAGLTGSAELRLQALRSPFEQYRDYVFGLVDEQYSPDLVPLEIEALDDQGNGKLEVTLPRVPDTTRPLRAELAIAIDEPGGRASRTSLTLPVRAAERMIGVKPRFADLAIDADSEAGFDILALDGDARPVAARLRVRLVRERPDWRVVLRGSQARYETVWRDEAVDSTDLAVTAAAPGRFARRLPFGRYRLEVSEPGGLVITSLRFRAGWAGGETPEVPDKVDVAADRRAYAPGEVARLRITPPFAGPASIAVLTDRLVSLREIQVAEGGTEVEVPVDAAWGPGAYVAITAYRPGEAKQGHPGRALGLAWLQLDPASRRIGIAIDTPERIAPRQRLTVPLRLDGAGGEAIDWRASGATLTLAAVDEGILRLTRFATPDPLGHFMGKRRLGVDIRDDYGRLVPPPEGELAVLRQGGDEFSLGSIDIPQRTVALFSGPVVVAPDGTANVTLDIPDFAGELRLMAVAWAGSRVGSASKPLTVRDAVVAEALLPRFLAPGDEARLPVLLHNLDLPAGEITATLRAEGAIALAGPERLAATLAPNARALPASALRATAAGQGVLRLSVAGPGGFTVEREARITIRSSRPITTEIASQSLAPGQEGRLEIPAARFLPGTLRATASFGGVVRYDAAGMLRLLDLYPFACLEQSSSQLLAFAATPPETPLLPERAARLQQAVEHVLNKQRYDGAFGLWSAQGEAQYWTGAYAVEGLLRARLAGAAVPEAALADALRQIAEQAEEGTPDTPEERAAQAYRLHVLSLAGQPLPGAARRLLEQLDALPTPLAKAQLGAAFARAGDTARAEQAFRAALAPGARQPWLYDYGTAERDLLAMAALLRESGLLPQQMQALQTRLPGANFTPAVANTQEAAWAVLAAQALGRDGRPARVALDGREQAPAAQFSVALSAPAVARNLGDAPLYVTTSVTGIPAQPLPAGRAGMRITRRFLGLDGQPLNLDTLRQNQVFVLLLEGRAETREAHRAILQQGLPAGWEIIGRLAAGEVPGMPWLGTLTETVASPALDDRFAAAMDLTPDAPEFRLAVRVRAVTAGQYELPGAQLEDMYRPQLFARQNTGRITVRPVE